MPVVAQQFMQINITEDRKIRRIAESEIIETGFTTPESLSQKTGKDIKEIKNIFKKMHESKEVSCSEDYRLCSKDMKSLSNLVNKLNRYRTT